MQERIPEDKDTNEYTVQKKVSDIQAGDGKIANHFYSV